MFPEGTRSEDKDRASIPRRKAIELAEKLQPIFETYALDADIGNGKKQKAYKIAGSLRRKKELVHDVDIVAVIPDSPRDIFNQNDNPRQLFREEVSRIADKVEKWGGNLASFVLDSVPFDIYFAHSKTFPTLLLIRTGSKEHNIRLAKRAISLGMRLKANGQGLENKDGNLIEVKSEEELFGHLNLEYKRPEDRD